MAAVAVVVAQGAQMSTRAMGVPAPPRFAGAAVEYTPHPLIRILGNANFTPANGVTGGNGAADNPYVISGWNLTDTWSAGSGVTLIDTAAYVVIRDLFINCSYRDAEPDGPFGIDLYNASHVTIDRVTVINNARAFEIGGSSDISILNSTALGNWRGVFLASSSDVRVVGNVLSGGDVPNPTSSMAVGVMIGECGVPSCPAVRVTIATNDILNNIQGLSVTGSTSISIYHNNIVNNTVEAWTDSSNYSWDGGYPSGGNYWSNYTGVDLCSGSQQNECTRPDGIGDTPYTFATGGVDHYPLMRPYAANGLPSAPMPAADFWAGPVLTVAVAVAAVVWVVAVFVLLRPRNRGRPGSPPPSRPPT